MDSRHAGIEKTTVRLNTVQKWWNHLRLRLCKKFGAQGVLVRPLLYDDLSETEQEIVYYHWLYRELLNKDLEKK
jgi:hypothetical protein